MGPGTGLGKTKPISAGRSHGGGTGRACPRAELALDPIRGGGCPWYSWRSRPCYELRQTNPISGREKGRITADEERSYDE